MNEPPPIPPPYPPQSVVPVYPSGMLGYADGSNRPGRPGLVTAMGVISIVLGALGILTNLVSGLYSIGFLILAIVGPMAGALNASRGSGMAASDRTVVLSALPQLPAARRQVLDDFLTERGKAVFPGRVRRAADVVVTASGITNPDGVQVNWFSVSGGRLEIADDYAAYYPSAGAPQPASSVLTPQEVDAAVAAVISNARARPPDSQLNAFRRIVARPEQVFLTPGSEIKLQIAGVIPTDKGGLTVFGASGGYLYLPPLSDSSAGSMEEPVEVEAPSPTGTVTAAPPATAPATKPAAAPVQFKLSIAGAALAVVEAVASLGVAIYLLVIGILVFRFSRRGRRHHYWYVALKLPLVVLFVLSWWWVVMGLVQTFGQAASAGQALPSPRAVSIGLLTAFILLGAMSAIYPVALLFALRSRAVREYYEGLET